jgi:hypothetical protein
MVSGFQTADIVPGFFASIAASIYPGQRSIKNNPFVRSGKDPSLRPDPAHDLCGAGGGRHICPHGGTLMVGTAAFASPPLSFYRLANLPGWMRAPVGMWSKASIPPFLRSKTGEAQPVG